MRLIVIQFLLSTAILTALDAVWFTVIMNRYFIEPLSHLLNIEGGHVVMRWIPAIMVYMLLSLGIVLFVLSPAGIVGQYSVFLRGAIFGAIVYGVYEGTNGALMKDWPPTLLIVDMLWGFLACGITATIVKALAR